MKKAPVIGLTANVIEGKLLINTDYFNAVLKSGGVPILMPYTTDEEQINTALDICDGFLFTGGGDIDPTYYGEARLPECGETDPERDVPEMALLKRALDTGKPIMAICRGMQILNVALGGTLWQDLPSQIPSEINHRVIPGTETAHSVSIIKGTPLHKLIGKESIEVNTVHHQGIKKLADGLIHSAIAPDGIIEAYYSESERYVRAYQWHPERIYKVCGESAPIFADFIAACKE